MSIAQDPADTTPSRTGGLCHVCNSQYASDRSAQHTHAIWTAAVEQDGNDYLRGHYWTNAAMHGLSGGKPTDAIEHCKSILRAQIRLLKPRIIIANGTVAADALHRAGVLSKTWSQYRSGLNRRVYSEDSGETQVYCTYHPSAKNININIPKLDLRVTESVLQKRITDAPSRVNDFLNSADGQRASMRLLLLHWLDIGTAIRRAHHRRE